MNRSPGPVQFISVYLRNNSNQNNAPVKIEPTIHRHEPS